MNNYATTALGSSIVTLFLMLGSAEAKFMRPDVEQVPTDRLIANLETKAKESPTVETLYALGRVHAIAYAQQQAQFDVLRKTGLPFFGYQDNGFLPVTAANPRPGDTNHLAKAIEWYVKAVEKDAKHLPSLMGLGWCQDQAGEKKAALSTYRKAFDLAWAREKQAGHVFGPCVTKEVAGYLLPLLEEKTDAAEIAKVKEIEAAAAKLPRAMTPILVPLEDGLSLGQMTDPKAAVSFDLDGCGESKRWGWPTPKAGWLVYDPTGKGEIRSGLQLIGGVTFWVLWENGYHALAALDDDHDGWLRGDELKGLAVWCDLNGNGKSEPGEVLPLSVLGIQALSCACQRHETGIPFNPAGVLMNDGRTRPTFDWVTQAK
jgi:hypothetical protein